MRQPSGSVVRPNKVATRPGFVFRLLLMTMACVAAPRSTEAQDPGVTWLIFVDDLHLDFRDTGCIRKSLRSIASHLIREEDRVVLRSSGPSFGANDLIVNRTLLEATTASLAGNSLPPAAILPSSLTAHEVRYRASLALSAATEMLKVAPSFPRRRAAMLYVSNGYVLDSSDSRLAAFSSAAQRFQVPVFAINAGSLPAVSARRVRDDAALAAMLNSLRMMSEPTGGIAVLNESEFVDALQRGVIDRWAR